MEQKLKTVPEWISRIREQLSVSYAGLGMKEKSDYNRNIYLDILEDTRQDKELESRYQALEKEAGQLKRRVVTGHCGLRACIPLLLVFQQAFQRPEQSASPPSATDAGHLSEDNGIHSGRCTD